MRDFVRRYPRYFLFLALAALAYRLFFVLKIPIVAGDSLVYADIAKNLLNHGIYGLSGDTGPTPTLIRLPGYPFFLALVFKFFGQDFWLPVLMIQALFDVATCFVIAATVRRCVNERAALVAFALAAFCPFTANYAATPLTETLSIFFISVALLFTVIGLEELRLAPWVGCGLAVALAIQLRPDGGWLLGAIGCAILLRFWIIPGERRALFRAGVAVLLLSLLPLVPWTIRNWRTFHVFQPLVSVHASDPGEWEPTGWVEWLDTWVVDYSTTEDITFKVSGETISMGDIPDRAFSSAEQKARVAELVARYNENQTLTPELDAQFARIAAEREAAHPFKVHVLLPLARLAAIWLRPRTEMLPFDTHWWRFSEDLHDSLWATFLMALNLAFLLLAVRGILHGPPMRFVAVFVFYILIRSAFLLLMNATEDRYTLECYPCLIVLASRCIAGWRLTRHTPARTAEMARV